MIRAMKDIAVECFKHPGRSSVWAPHEGEYLCLDSEELASARRQEALGPGPRASEIRRPPIDRKFKLIFVTAAVGTLLFTIICVSLHLITDGEPPPAMGKLIDGMFDLVKIGFGAVVGLLGGQAMAKGQPQ